MIKKNRSLFRNGFNLLLVMMLIGTCIFFNSVAADQATTLNNSDLDIGKSVEVNDDGENLYNIVFSLPTAIQEEPTEVDIVFVMDQTSIANYSQVRNQINEFLDGIASNDRIKLNIGVIKFALDIDKSVSSLITVTTSNLATVKNLFRTSISSGSNMYGGILAGKELLETGNALDENKYLILASDFGGYKSDAGNGKGLSFFYHHAGANQGVTAVTDNSEFHSKYFAYNTIDLTNAFFTVDKVDNLIRNKTFFNGVSVSDETEKYLTQFGPSIGEYPDSWRNPYANYGTLITHGLHKKKRHS